MGGEELSDAERDEMLQLCRRRLDTFRMQRGEKMGCLLTDARIDVNPPADRCADAERLQRPALHPPSSPPAMGERAGFLTGAWGF